MEQLAQSLHSEVCTGECLKAATQADTQHWSKEPGDLCLFFFFFSRNTNELARMLWERRGGL